jgi:hypothetical protein
MNKNRRSRISNNGHSETHYGKRNPNGEFDQEI